MNINIISKVDIKVTEEDLKKLLSEEIKKFDPAIEVDSIEFIQRRNPNRLDINVSAYIGNKPTSPTYEEEVETSASAESEENETYEEDDNIFTEGE